eukprot:864389-Karenia_brevis.AAC.1
MFVTQRGPFIYIGPLLKHWAEHFIRPLFLMSPHHIHLVQSNIDKGKKQSSYKITKDSDVIELA